MTKANSEATFKKTVQAEKKKEVFGKKNDEEFITWAPK
jgi:hypothetical protein